MVKEKIRSNAARGDVEEALQMVQGQLQPRLDAVKTYERDTKGYPANSALTKKGTWLPAGLGSSTTVVTQASGSRDSNAEAVRRGQQLATTSPPSAQQQRAPVSIKRQRISDVGLLNPRKFE